MLHVKRVYHVIKQPIALTNPLALIASSLHSYQRSDLHDTVSSLLESLVKAFCNKPLTTFVLLLQLSFAL